MINEYLQQLQESNNIVKYIYHIINPVDKNTVNLLKEYGLCSPRKLYEVNKDLFKKYSFEIYKERASSFLKKSIKDLTNEDILFFLDNNNLKKREHFNSKTIFFTFISLKESHKSLFKKLRPGLELTINIEKIKKYKPILVGIQPSGIRKSSWSEINGDEIQNEIQKIKNIKSDKKLAFIGILHLALNCYHIPYKNIDKIDYVR